MLDDAAAAARTVSASERSVSRGAPQRAAQRLRAARRGWRGRRACARAARCRRARAPAPTRAARQPAVVSENITDIRSVAATPSTMQWCTFDSSAQRPPSSPSTTHSSHSGLSRSRCCEKTRAGHLPQLLLASRRRHRRVAQVVVEAEVRIVDPRRRADRERHEANLLSISRHQLELARDHRPQVLKRRRRPLEDADAADVHWRGGVLDVQEGRVDRTHPLHATSVRAVEHLLEHSVDLRVNRHAAVARVDLDQLRVGIQARAPVDDPVAARVHRDGLDARPPAARRGPLRKPAQHSPSLQLVENTPGIPRSPSRATSRTVRSTCAETARPSHTGEPSITSPHTSSGSRTASARASAPPRLWPISTTRSPQSSREPLELVLQALRRSRSAQPTLTRMPLIATRWPRRRSQPRITRSELSPAMKPGISITGWASSRRPGARRRRVREQPRQLAAVAQLPPHRRFQRRRPPSPPRTSFA